MKRIIDKGAYAIVTTRKSKGVYIGTFTVFPSKQAHDEGRWREIKSYRFLLGNDKDALEEKIEQTVELINKLNGGK